MAERLDRVFPWGRTFDEYVAMFGLTEADLRRRIAGCGDGPAAFNARMHACGRRVVSIDPLYQFSPADVRRRIDETFPTILAHAEEYRHRYLWETVRSVEHLGQIRGAAMDDFLADYEAHRQNGQACRYLAAALPRLPLRDRAFDLALCSHLLFTYSDQLDRDFHLAAAAELIRIADEVRIFPLVNNYSHPSPHCEAVTRMLEDRGYSVAVRRVPYHFQVGGNEMLVVRRR